MRLDPTLAPELDDADPDDLEFSEAELEARVAAVRAAKAAKAARTGVEVLTMEELDGVLPPAACSLEEARRLRVRPDGWPLRGIYHHRRTWFAQFRAGGVSHYLGTFATPEAAARAWDRAVVARGLDRPLNFPESAPPIERAQA